MGKAGGALRALSPSSLLRVYLALVVCAAALAAGAVVTTTMSVEARSREAASAANAASAAAQVQAELRGPLLLMVENAHSFLLSDEAAASLTEAQRIRIGQAIASGLVEPAASGLLPQVLVPLADRDAVALERSVDLLSGQIDELADGVGEVNLAPVVGGRDRLLAALAAYFQDGSAANFAAVFSSLLTLGQQLDAVQDQLALAATAAQLRVNEATSRARTVMILSLAALALIVGASTLFVARRICEAFASSERERASLEETSETLRYRNDQLSALYAVFSEITDTLSMRYVIGATLRETLHVMGASMVVLRLLQDGYLTVVGNLTSEGKEIPNLLPVALGEGPTGRVARRGRSMRIDHGAQAMLGPSPVPHDPNAGVESGIIVPLIVGARVVGTLAVWSRRESAFTDDDERVLEMMASQVATAVVAADNAENSERRALLDPLTGLPNRRQLAADIDAHYENLRDGVVAAVAMIDVDNFKAVNDEYGHRVGDVSLQKVAAVLRNAMRDGDSIYRYGGEEFVAIFKGASGAHALTAAERLRLAVETTPFTGDQLETVSPITISIGVAFMPDHGRDVYELIEKADRAMYRAKESGRNRVEVWKPADGGKTPVAA